MHRAGSLLFALATVAACGSTVARSRSDGPGPAPDAATDAGATVDGAPAEAGPPGDGGAPGDAGGPGDAGSPVDTGLPGDGGCGDPASVWTPLDVMTVTSPLDHGAAGDGVADDLAALEAAVSALPAGGGIVYLPAGKTFHRDDLLVITKAHVKLWAPNRQATIFGSVHGVRRRQAILCRDTSFCGFFGLRLTSDAAERFDALEDNQISTDNATDVEIAGCEIDGSAATGIFLYGASRRLYIEGNYVHRTYADHIHHTDGTRESWCWDNWIDNQAPSNGDDGIACVTYCPTCPLCGDMEWWRNTHLGSGWGRGYAVIGGDHILIHHNWALRTSAAGVIVASEPSYNSASSNDITIHDNWLYQCAQGVGHPGILVSGLNSGAAPLTNIDLDDNVVVDTATGQAYREEGSLVNVTNDGLSTAFADLPAPLPTTADVAVTDTAILRTRDPSFVAEAARLGLYRIHVRETPGGAGFQQRFEYVVSGPPPDVAAWTAARCAAGDHLVEQRDVGGTTYALVLTPAPRTVPAPLTGVAFPALRAGDRDGTLSWLWDRVNAGTY